MSRFKYQFIKSHLQPKLGTGDAFDKAVKATKDTDAIVTKYRHSSIILDREERIIGIGRNHWTGLIILVDENTADGSSLVKKTTHSEINALSKVNIRRLKGAIILNYGRTNVRTVLSRPCNQCWNILYKLGFNRVWFSLESSLTEPLWKEEIF